MKKFYFTDDSWWDEGFGCDCCPVTLMECYNSSETHSSLGSAHSKLECYIQAIITVLLKRNYSCPFDSEAFYLMEEEEIEALCAVLGVEVEIHG